MLTRRALLALAVCSLVFSTCPFAFGQATGSISGTVTDASGSSVAGAKVTVAAEAIGLTRVVTTDDGGHYLAPLLPVANYSVRVEFAGFQTTEEKDIRLQVDEHREVDFKLAPASVQQAVEVTGTAVAVETENPTLGQVITSQQVAELPLNGRDFVQLAGLTPGTVQETNPNSFFNGGPSSEVSARGSYSLSVGGSRANATDWLFDGNDNNELTAGGIAILPSIDAIQEFKVLTYNYSAEYGTRAGPTVLVTTKSGSNSFHGSVFEFFRNTDLDARSFFATSTEKFNLNQFGGSIGGPIKKDKTFFFADYQGKRQRRGIPFTGLVPSVAMRNGDFTDDALGNLRPLPGMPCIGSTCPINNPYATTKNAMGQAVAAPFVCDSSGNPIPAAPDGSQGPGTPCNKIPQNLIDPITQQMINLYPLPNANNPVYNYVNEPTRSLNEGEFDIRLDQNFGPKDNAFARFSYDQATSYVPGGAPGFAEQAPFASNQSILNHGRNAAISETHIFSEHTVNQFNFGFNRIFNHIDSYGTGSCESQKLGIPGANLGGDSCGLTSTQQTGYWSLGDRGYTPFQGGTNIFSVSDSLDLVRGKHDIKVGGNIRANQMNVKAIGFQDGYWIFSGDWAGDTQSSFLLGLPDLAIHDQTLNGDITGRRWKIYRPYIQDDWRVSKSLTLNLGLGWALPTPISEAANREANFNVPTQQLLVAGGGSPCSGPAFAGLPPCVPVNQYAGVQRYYKAFEPRVGVAWKPFGSQNTVIRGGYAIFHDSAWSQGAQGLWQNPPYFFESGAFAFGGGCAALLSGTSACVANGLTPTNISASNGFAPFTSFGSFTGALNYQNLNFEPGRVQQFNVNVEHEFPGQIVVTAGYAGSRSSHILVYGNNLNVNSPSACGTASGYTLGCGFTSPITLPSLAFSDIYNFNDVGIAHYNSFQLKAETKSARHGLYALIGYTYSRSYDTGFTDGLGTSLGATFFPLPNWQNLDYALSPINLNHDFTASVIYELPFGRGKHFGSSWSGPVNTILGGWEATVIEKAISGFPIFVVDSNNASGTAFYNNGLSLNRPNQTCSTLSLSCFSAPPPGELGDASRTPVSGPRFVNTDFSVIKHFPIREQVRLDFRAEFFNLLNHPQFGLPVNLSATYADISSPLFGAITSTVNNPRLVQFALKLLF